mgnify:CR=1 FL=1
MSATPIDITSMIDQITSLISGLIPLMILMMMIGLMRPSKKEEE